MNNWKKLTNVERQIVLNSNYGVTIKPIRTLNEVLKELENEK